MKFNNPTTSTSEDDRTDSDSTISDKTSTELTWDESPSQYTLTPNSYPKTASLPPPSPIPTSTPFPRQAHIQPFTRSRIFATSEPPLERKPAFKATRSDQAFLSTPTSEDIQPLSKNTPRRTRIPMPVSPSDVDLHQVSNVDAVLPYINPPPRRSIRRSTRPEYYGTRDQDDVGEKGTKKKK